MFQKRKKFKEEVTPEKRLSDCWDQKVFFITKKYPAAQDKISEIMSAHAQGAAFVPSEAALAELADMYSDLQSLT